MDIYRVCAKVIELSCEPRSLSSRFTNDFQGYCTSQNCFCSFTNLYSRSPLTFLTIARVRTTFVVFNNSLLFKLLLRNPPLSDETLFSHRIHRYYSWILHSFSFLFTLILCVWIALWAEIAYWKWTNPQQYPSSKVLIWTLQLWTCPNCLMTK